MLSWLIALLIAWTACLRLGGPTVLALLTSLSVHLAVRETYLGKLYLLKSYLLTFLSVHLAVKKMYL